MPQITGIMVTEWKESGRLEMDLDGSMTGERIFDVTGIENMRVALIYGLLGYPHNNNNLDTRGKPHSFGDVPELYCTHVESVGFSGVNTSGEDGSARHTWYRVRAIYNSLPYEVEGDDKWLEEYQDFSGEFMPLGEGVFKWLSDGVPIDQNIGKIIGGIDRTWILHRVTSFSRKTLLKNIGKINKTKFQGSAKGTLVFIGASISRQNQPTGAEQPYQIALKFKERAQPWNYAYRPGPNGGKWEEIDPSPYKVVEYDTLIKNVDPP